MSVNWNESESELNNAGSESTREYASRVNPPSPDWIENKNAEYIGTKKNRKTSI